MPTFGKWLISWGRIYTMEEEKVTLTFLVEHSCTSQTPLLFWFFFFIKPLRDFTPPLNVHDFFSSYTIQTIPLSVAGTFPVLPLSVCFPPPRLTFTKCELGGRSERWRGAPSPGHWASMVRAASDHSLKQLTFQTGNKGSPGPSRTIKQC